MDIRIKVDAIIENYETQATIKYTRKREDYAKLLKQLKEGKSLKAIFSSEPIAKAVFNKLKRDGFVDSLCKVTVDGSSFIDDPKLEEVEEGIFSVSVARIQGGIADTLFVPVIKRKLSSENLEKKQVSFPLVSQDVEFHFDGANECFMRSVSLGPGGWAYLGQQNKQSITFHVADSTYVMNEKSFSLGKSLGEKVLREAQSIVSNDFPYSYLTDDLRLVVKDAEDFPVKDLLSETCSLSSDSIELENVPLIIKSMDAAYQYVYLWLYDLLMKGNYYSLSEMNEIVQNEVLTRPIIDSKIRDRLISLTVSREGFKQYLSQSLYAKLDYKLRIVDEYLGIQSIAKDTTFSTVKDYWSLLEFLSNKVSPSEVNRLYLVMGYAFVKRRDNHILDCLNVLKTRYPNITIVCKKGRTAVEEEPGLRTRVTQMGVSIVDKNGLGDHYHDRYLVFEKTNKTYSVLVSGPEIGQLFHDGETKGQMYQIPLTDTVKGNKSLVEMIKE